MYVNIYYVGILHAIIIGGENCRYLPKYYVGILHVILGVFSQSISNTKWSLVINFMMHKNTRLLNVSSGLH